MEIMQPTPPKYVRVKEASALLGVSPATLYRSIANGYLPATKFGGCLLIPYGALESLRH